MLSSVILLGIAYGVGYAHASGWLKSKPVSDITPKVNAIPVTFNA